ncbi:hypothetical protein CY34DRAFT_16595 [Suillus luteus UH-Slu-Lm8-n1]|uniref:Uncharacterized protein n=1 Tax=Suillus luteus UH-Slu-Lm8-n1 TaxID=930992 RepID=A0A0D0AP37_9AGAM|nr:hypothetical protein CY34DRAFT_16595 [Suillus luteus UH-Slu-Lm8-n1]
MHNVLATMGTGLITPAPTFRPRIVSITLKADRDQHGHCRLILPHVISRNAAYTRLARYDMTRIRVNQCCTARPSNSSYQLRARFLQGRTHNRFQDIDTAASLLHQALALRLQPHPDH